MRWVKRNEDKPHRCPECHAVASWGKDCMRPKTKLVCPNDCGVQWRYGLRMKKFNMSDKQYFAWLAKAYPGICEP
jgi:hypothetical protein